MANQSKSRSSSVVVSTAAPELQLFRIPNIPEIRPGNDLVKIVTGAARRAAIHVKDGDILVIAQKIVSKAEGALVQLARVKPSPHALAVAARLKKDPRAVEVVLQESRRIVRSDPVLIAETRHGFVCANAGVDHSNVPENDVVTLLPRNPDQSARKLAAALRKRTGKRVAVIISDTFGRPWRLGLTYVAIGASGVPVLRDLRGTRDRDGKSLTATGFPVVVIRGYRYKPSSEPAASVIRPAAEDLFR
ncbi:MAG: coenzyme F420-0:L-glutamate ligase [Acidobacteria bacterium]|nr:MAG: coenzyme F420-0:L-glutamate ligase [Acidobacteriota bacterium]